MKKWMFLILALSWMVLIFRFSARDIALSSQDSSRASLLVGHLLIPHFDELPQEEKDAFAARLDHPIRKASHAAEYAVLAVFWFFCLRAAGVMNSESLFRKLLPWILVSIYAATDEFHQLFVPGRSGQISDVLLDSAGAATGLVLAGIIMYIVRKIKRRSIGLYDPIE